MLITYIVHTLKSENFDGWTVILVHVISSVTASLPESALWHPCLLQSVTVGISTSLLASMQHHCQCHDHYSYNVMTSLLTSSSPCHYQRIQSERIMSVTFHICYIWYIFLGHIWETCLHKWAIYVTTIIYFPNYISHYLHTSVKIYVTNAFLQVVTHLSTNQACGCFTSVINCHMLPVLPIELAHCCFWAIQWKMGHDIFWL